MNCFGISVISYIYIYIYCMRRQILCKKFQNNLYIYIYIYITMQSEKNDVKSSKSTRNQRKNSPYHKGIFWLPSFLKSFPGMIFIYIYIYQI